MLFLETFMFFSTEFDSPIGSLQICFSDKGVRKVFLPGRACNNNDEMLSASRRHPLAVQALEQLSQYFSGNRERFELPLDLDGTEFQMKVWKSLAEIKYGATKTYGAQAKRVGSPKAARAVGAANAANPIPIILPCHRVIGANGALTGYGGGSSLLYIKEFLLDLEKVNSALA